MDLSKLPNPYDFANPVSDPALFAGRSEELSDIRYYLDHGSRAARPMNLAIMGERASGKTSILNMIQFEAQKRGFCVVRVDLDEGDAESLLGFFYKIFDAVLTEAASCGAYGGLSGRTYDTYRDMADAYDIPECREFCSFLFPIQYAKAMGAGNRNVMVSDAAFKRDLANIQAELKRPLAILFDECDVLTKSRVHLEKLRNVFMNIPGVMLVFTGTPALFPLMDDVFSPIVRQFKKINLRPFGQLRDTQDCIRKPLESVAIKDPSAIFDFEELGQDVRDIHDLSGGRPYEIRLICHVMFRRVQEGRADRMRLTLSVLDDVRRELQTSQDVSTRPVISAVRSLDEGQLSALRRLCACNGRANFDKIWFAEYVFHGEKRWTNESLQNHLRTFEQMGVLNTDGGAIRFSGDAFDRIYCKYLARSVEVPLAIQDLPYELLLTMSLRSFVVRDLELGWSDVDRSILQLTMSGQDRVDLEPVAMALLDEREESDPFQSTPSMADKVYWHSIDFRGRPSFEVALVTITTPWVTVSRLFSCQDPKRPESFRLLDVASMLADPSARAVALGGNLTVATDTLPVVPLETLVKKVEQSGNARMRDSLFRKHAGRMGDAYIEARDVEEALFHGKLAYRYDPDPSDSTFANNLGYLFMVADDLPRARKLLEKAAMSREEGKIPALAAYNLGVVEAKEGNPESALAEFRVAIDRIRAVEEAARRVGCLLQPKIAEDEARLEFEEVFRPDLLETAQCAVSALEQLLRTE